MDIFDNSMYDYMLKKTENQPKDNIVWHFFGKSFSFAKFIVDIDKVTTFLVEKGVKKGDNVVLCLGNIPNAIVTFYAINKIGAIANIVHPLVRQARLKEIVDDMNPKLLILFDEFYDNYLPWLENLDKDILICSACDYLPKIAKQAYGLYIEKKKKNIKKNKRITYFSKLDKQKNNCPCGEVDGDDIAVYMHSGGTTGKAKTVMLSNSAFNHLSDNIINILDDKTDNRDAMLMVLPIFHTFGLGICMHTALVASLRIVLMPKFEPKRACRLIKKYSISFVAGVPNMYGKMLNCGKFEGKYLKKIRECYVGGDRLSEKIEMKFEEAMTKAGNPLTLSQGYGLTEACVASVNAKNIYRKDSIGKPLKGNEFAIIDENENFLPSNEKGMLVVASNHLMKGYYNDENTTRKSFFVDKNGKKWLKTGDIAYIDEDGYAFFVDREKRLIKISGMNVFPQEIETLVSKLEFVENCCLIKKMYNNKCGTLLFVALKTNVCYNNKNFDAISTIREAIAYRMLKYYMPQEIRIVESLPMTQIGKVDYKMLEEKENSSKIGGSYV